MRIAIAVFDENTVSALGAAEGFRFYEDDHGRITRQFFVPLEGTGLDASVALLERYGVDALICAEVGAEERRAVGMAGLMLFESAAATADEAVTGFLSGSVVSDTNNTCNACGHRALCASGGGSCSLK